MSQTVKPHCDQQYCTSNTEEEGNLLQKYRNKATKTREIRDELFLCVQKHTYIFHQGFKKLHTTPGGRRSFITNTDWLFFLLSFDIVTKLG